MKKTPKRSTSLVSTLSRPVIEKRTISPTPSFSSSILMQGMSENLSHLSSRTSIIDTNEQSTSNHHRRRLIDFSRRRTITGFNDQTNNKENRFVNSQKYYFHRNSNDLLMNSYGLQLLDREQQPKVYSSKIITHIQPKKFVPHNYSPDALDDLLCDREVESYFYPSKSQHVYINLQTSIQGTLC